MKKRVTALIALFFLVIPFCYADSFTFKSNPIKDRVVQDEWAIFDITLQNNQSSPDVFKLGSKVEGTEWSILTESTFDYSTGVTVMPRSSKTVRIMLKDKGLAPNLNKAYVVDISAESSSTGEKKTELIKIFIIPGPAMVYQSDIAVTMNVPRYIDPRNIYSFIVNIKNNNPKDIKNLHVTLESSLINREGTVELAPDIQKSVEFTVGFEEDQKPLLDTLTVKVSDDKGELYRETLPIEVVSYRIPFDSESSIEKHFLVTTETITLTNKEVVAKQERVYLPLSPLDAMFVTSEPLTVIVEKEGKSNLAWDIKLPSGESTKIVIMTNYRLPFYVFLAILLILMLYYVFRDPIVVFKHAEGIQMLEGGIKEMKVVLTFRNRSKRQLNKVTIVDKVPHLIEVEKKHDIGTLVPRKIIHTKQGTLLTWELEMDSKEERLIKYLVRSRLSILGGMKLPPAMVFVHDNKGSKRRIRSNEVNISEA